MKLKNLAVTAVAVLAMLAASATSSAAPDPACVDEALAAVAAADVTYVGDSWGPVPVYRVSIPSRNSTVDVHANSTDEARAAVAVQAPSWCPDVPDATAPEAPAAEEPAAAPTSETASSEPASAEPTSTASADAARIAELEAQVAALEQEVARLRAERDALIAELTAGTGNVNESVRIANAILG